LSTTTTTTIAMSNDQDWETVVFRKKQAPAKKKLSSAELNNARLAGQVETVKKCNACRRLEAMRAFDRFPVATKDSQGSNKQRTVAPSRKLDDDDVDARTTLECEWPHCAVSAPFLNVPPRASASLRSRHDSL
jgi:hypothetical protein